jgi:hypothetical protein
MVLREIVSHPEAPEIGASEQVHAHIIAVAEKIIGETLDFAHAGKQLTWTSEIPEWSIFG